MGKRVDTGADAIYNSGFTSHASRSNIKIETDSDTILLFQELISTPSKLDNWDYKEKVLKTTAKLLFPLAPWVMAQRANTMHSKHALLFVRDLVQVALGGERSMSVRMRIDLMMDSAVEADPIHLRADISQTDSYIPMALIDQLRDYDAGCALANLTDTPEKLREMVQSLYVMFGTGR